MSIIGEAILSASIEFLFKELTSPELLQFGRQEQIHADLQKWERILRKIQAALNDAEEKQRVNESVKIWLGELRNLAYDIEDLLDEFSTEALRRKLLLEPQHEAEANTSMVRKLIPTCCNSFSPRSFKFNSMMRSKIKEITERLQDIATEKNNLDLKETSARISGKIREKLPTTSLVNEATIYGRETEKEAIIELLLRDEGMGDRVAVIPIIGMGGVGKTTLAQLVYNDDRIQGHFDLRVWGCVSDDFDVIRVTKTVLRSISNETVEDNDLNLLQVKLKDRLSKKKFLLVLDDIWNENYDDWTVLRNPFEAGSRGSKIVVTTRNQGVSSMMGTLPAYPLKELSYNDCLYVFIQHSLEKKDFNEHQDLKEIGEQIVKRCNGLPLAAKTLGGLLRGKYEPNDWEDVLNSPIWNLPEERNGLLPALRLSYHYLPQHLKQCFAYCSVFSKDYAFQKEEVILLWMAQGLLQHEISGKHMEDLGHKCFYDLEIRSFFQRSVRDTSRFEMHDLINDLAQWAGGEMYFRIENMQDKNWKFSKNIRHLSYISRRFEGTKKFELFHDIKHLRTFLPLMIPKPGYCFLPSTLLLHFLLKLQYLRILSLRGYHISKLPNQIGDLKHLRYLDLSYTPIQTLPQSFTSLHNLQTLVIECCRSLTKLCEDIGNLINLRHLCNPFVDSLEEMPLRIGKLTSLRTLSNFVVGKNVGSRLAELKSLTLLQEVLMISGLENVVDVEDAKEADLNGKKNLNEVLLEWTCAEFSERKAEMETHVLEMLQPHKKLEVFTIKGYGGTKFPTWLGDSSFSKLVCLRFEDCSKCTSLPPLGQLPSLKDLVINGMAGVKRLGSEFYGSGCDKYFPSLETLCFEDLHQWEDWIHDGPGLEAECFSNLRELDIVNCSKLEGRLPEHLPSLERLVIRSCEQLQLSILSLGTVCRLEIDGCKEIVQKSTIDFNSLNSVLLSDISINMFQKWFMGRLSQLETLKIVSCKELTFHNGIGLLRNISSLRRLEINDCPGLLSMVAEEEGKQQQQGLPCNLQSLGLSNCKSLVRLPQELPSSLGMIRITNCPQLVSFPEADLPTQLRFIEIERCNALKSLPVAWMSNNNNTSLERLSIISCDSLLYIARIQIHTNLKRLEIKSCNNLRAVVDDKEVLVTNQNIKSGSSRNTSLLEYLEIGYCPFLISLWSKSDLPLTLQHIMVSNCSNLASLSPKGNLPKALKYIDISYCPNLESIAERFENNTSLESIEISSCENLKFLPDDLHKLCHLSKISIRECSSLVSFPEGGFPPTKLTEISIYRCEKLESLPNCIHNLTSLQNLTITKCPGIASFPENGFPNNLTSLRIEDLKICKLLLVWGLHRFPSLRELFIDKGCPDVVSFPKVPTSLTSLRISKFPNLEFVSSIGQNLTSLEILTLFRCPKLKSFPEKGLPRSLLQLFIWSCPLLEQKCKKDVGQFWPMIAHIPCILIDAHLELQ